MTLRQLLGDALYERAIRFSRRNYGCPMSELIRRALNDWLDRNELPVAPQSLKDAWNEFRLKGPFYDMRTGLPISQHAGDGGGAQILHVDFRGHNRTALAGRVEAGQQLVEEAGHDTLDETR